MAKISGPLMDRMDIHIDVPLVEFQQNALPAERRFFRADSLAVQQARRIQRQRFGHPFMTNAMMGHKQVEKFCDASIPPQKCCFARRWRSLLFSTGFTINLQRARTIADLEGSESIQPAHIAEAK